MKINHILKAIFHKIELSVGFKKYFLNTGWLLFNNVFEMIIALFVGIYVARYLGPNNYGLFSYAGSFVGLFAGITTLGLDNIVVRELVKDEKKRDELLGTTFVLKIIGSILVLIIIVIAVRFTNNDSFTNLLIFVIAIGTIFQSFNVIKFYFQAKVLSKYTVYAQVFSAILCAAIKLLLIYFNMGLIYFAIVTLLQSIILASGFIVMYTKQKSSLLNWSINFGLAKNLLKDSWPLMLSGVAISIYLKIDQVMIKNMLDTKAVGNYAVAVRLSEAWYFIPMAITSSVFPAIINAKKISEKLYYERLQKLYDLMVIFAISIIIPITFLSEFIIHLLFGPLYNQAASILSIHIWALIFVCLGTARSNWILPENLQRYSLIYLLIGAITNILLNLLLIPRFGTNGAAYATLFSQILSSYFGAFWFKKTRIAFFMQTKSIFTLGTYSLIKAKRK